MELAYASLHQLCGPLLDRLELLPGPQRHALEVVFGLSDGDAPGRFLVGLAVLGLLSERRPSARCWPDRRRAVAGPDVGADARVRGAPRAGRARRLGVRGPGRRRCAPPLPELPLVGLRNGDARAVLRSAVRFRLDEQVATASSPRRAATRSRWSSCPAA